MVNDMLTAASIKSELKKMSDMDKAVKLQRFFKTGRGEYAEGDIFLGITVPDQRKLAGKYNCIQLDEIEKLLNDPIHECRLTALIILVKKYTAADDPGKEKIVELYLSRTDRINNWDLVDLSAHQILGHYFSNRDRSRLYLMAEKGTLWEQRMAVVATYHFIKRGDFTEILAFSKLLLNHKHDLIHKATGWMLREAGKMDISVLKQFLDQHHKVMPRTMLRYSIEKLNKSEKALYMKR